MSDLTPFAVREGSLVRSVEGVRIGAGGLSQVKGTPCGNLEAERTCKPQRQQLQRVSV